MTKMTKRILSSVLTVLMIVSMVAVFTLPAAMAVEAPNTTDYEAIYEDAYLINPEWHDGELITDKLLYFTFRGVEREVVCDPERCFNSWADAYEAVYGIGKMDASNIYTKKPVFIFAPGTYDELIHLPANATILGNNAGISPNADMTDDEWTADAVKENDGWKKNDARAEETIFTYGFYPSTRTGPDYNAMDDTGTDESRFAYYLEAGKPASNATITVEIDGVKVYKTGSGHVFTMHHYDRGKKIKYPATASEIEVTSGRICNLIARNSVLDVKGNVFYSNNAAYNNVKAYMYDCELLNNNAQIAQRDFSVLEMERVFWHHSGTSASIANNSNLLGYNSVYYASVYTTSDINIKDCVFYELAGGDSLFKVGSNYDRFHGQENDKNREKSVTHNVNFDGNIFYNAKSTNSPSAANVINIVDYDKSSSVKVNITNNIFHQEGKYVYAPVDKTANHTNNKDSLVMSENVVTGDFLNTGLGEAKYFVDELAKGITVNGVTFTKDNTAVYLAGTDAEQTAFFAGQKYIFEVDNKNVFTRVTGADPAAFAGGTRTVFTNVEAFKNKNIILPSGSYGAIFFHVPANYYGANFGVDPNDKSGATAANGYEWTLNNKWGAGGETKIGECNMSRAVTEGDFVFDGITLAGRYYDDHRNKRTGDVNVTFVNQVVNCGVTTPTNSHRQYNLNNALAMNGSASSIAEGQDPVAVGKALNDSFTLKNVRLVNVNSRDLFNEYVSSHVTLDSVYLDQTAALKARNVMGFVKLGGNNTTFRYTVKNSNFRNASDASAMWQFNVYQNAPAPLNAQIPAGYTSEVEFTNNIFYNAVTGAGNIAYVHHAGYLTKLNFSDNKIINTNNVTASAIKVQNLNTDTATCLLDGNVTVNNNTLNGWTTALINDLGWGDANPQITNVDNHKYGDGVASGNANCQQTADIRYYCQGCDTYGADCQYFKEVTGGTGNHVWDEGVYNGDATCQADGTKHVCCIIDGCDVEDDIPAPGTKVDHKFNDADYVSNNDALCYKAGTETAECAFGCGETDTRTNATKYPATGAHVWGEYTSNNDATYRNDGTKTAKCTTEGCTATNTVADEGSKLPAPPAKDAADTFKDVKAGKWYKKAVDHAVTYGLISGVSADNFGLDVTINRGMFITILARVAGVDTTANANNVATKFTDVEKGRYYTAAIKWASENGIVAGMTETTFAPTASITRQQLAVMINNFAKNQKVELKAVENAVTFADAGEIAGWAKDAVVACQKANIINGYNEGGKMTFKPTASATRAEAAQMLYVFHANFYLA